MAKVLIVEDDPLMSRMYQKIFTFEGFEVVVAHDGEEGWEKLKKEKLLQWSFMEHLIQIHLQK